MPSSKNGASHGGKNKKRKFEHLERAASPEHRSKDQENKSLVERLRERDEKIEDLKKQLEWALGMVALREQVTTHEKSISDLQEQVVEIKALMVGRIPDNDTTVAPRQDQIEDTATVTALQGQIDEMKSDLETQIADLEDVVEKQDGDQIDIAMTMAGVDGLKTAVGELREEFAVLHGQVNGQWEALGATIKGFQK